MSPKSVHILVIEDLAVVRESLAVALGAATDIESECCSNTDEAIDILKRQPGHFDVVLLKQAVGSEKADALLSLTNETGLKGKVLVMTPWLSDLERRRLSRLGVAGIFTMQGSLTDLIDAIRDVASGQAWFDKPPEGNGSRRNETFTCQERRAAELVFEGLSNREIGARMRVSESCIKAVLRRVFLKMRVHSRGQLVRALSENSSQAHHLEPMPPSQPGVPWPVLLNGGEVSSTSGLE